MTLLCCSMQLALGLPMTQVLLAWVLIRMDMPAQYLTDGICILFRMIVELTVKFCGMTRPDSLPLRLHGKPMTLALMAWARIRMGLLARCLTDAISILCLTIMALIIMAK